jgi:D-alanyl-D-alanine carboxypeptidase
MNSHCLDQIQASVNQILAGAALPGAAIAAYIDGQLVLETSIGDRDIHQSAPMPADASFYIYSITKPLIAAAVLHQVNAGQLDLDAPIQRYWPHFPVESPITLRQILSHTSGLPDYGVLPTYSAAVKSTPDSPWTAEMFFDVARTQGLRFEPGTDWSYSNLGYLALKALLEETTGQSLQSVLDDLFFTPLALTQTFVATSLDDVAPLTPGYTSSFGNELQNMVQCYHPGWVAHGVVIATAVELAKMINALFQGRILPWSSIEQMTLPLKVFGHHPPFTAIGYGLGVFVDTDPSYGRVAGHTGEGPGYSVAASHLGNRPTTVTALVNQDRHDAGLDLVYAVAAQLAEA